MAQELGVDITTADVIETLSFFDSWEERYKYVIDLGKELPPMAENLKTDENLVAGCQSRVWLSVEQHAGHVHLKMDSEAFIVKGLLALILVAYNGKTPQSILNFPIADYFSQLDLVRHLSATRGNGLQAMVEKIRSIAANLSAC